MYIFTSSIKTSTVMKTAIKRIKISDEKMKFYDLKTKFFTAKVEYRDNHSDDDADIIGATIQHGVTPIWLNRMANEFELA